jgi:transcriptional regulator with XRE-family HTH domain
MMMHYSDIYDKIKERRALLGITQQELADISGTGVRTIKAMETKKANPSMNTLLKIIDVLGMELDLKIKRTVE